MERQANAKSERGVSVTPQNNRKRPVQVPGISRQMSPACANKNKMARDYEEPIESLESLTEGEVSPPTSVVHMEDGGENNAGRVTQPIDDVSKDHANDTRGMKAQGAHGWQKSQKAQKAQKAQKSQEAQEAQISQEAQETQEAQEAQEATEVPVAPVVSDTRDIPNALEDLQKDVKPMKLPKTSKVAKADKSVKSEEAAAVKTPSSQGRNRASRSPSPSNPRSHPGSELSSPAPASTPAPARSINTMNLISKLGLIVNDAT
jgi:hypothetical protein